MITSDTHPQIDESRGPKVLIRRDTDASGENAPRYACHRCGATSYRAIMTRGADGAMRASERNSCTGCRLEFDSVAEWTGTANHIHVDGEPA